MAIGLLLVIAACSTADDANSTTPTSAVDTSAPTAAVATTATSQPVADLALVSLAVSAAASRSSDGFPAAAAIDGNPDTWWGAGEGPTQWIEVDFGAVADVHEVRLVVSQDPPGASVHRILDPVGVLLFEFSGETADLDELVLVLDEPWEGLTGLRIETVESPSWVAWREISLLGVVSDDIDDRGADLVFVNGIIETMVEGFETTDAVAIADGVIVGLGEEARALVGTTTRVIDLEGRAVLPGIVDPHTHVLTDDAVGFAEAQDRHISLGYTSVGDTGLSREQVAEMIDRAESGDLRLRLTGYLHRTDNCGVDEGTWYEEIPAGSEYGERFRIAGIKIFNDGGTCGPLAASEPFLDGVEIGPTFFSVQDLTAMIRRADGGGYQVVIHAQGDLAVAGAQDALASVLGGRGNVLRHRIDHNAILTPDIVGRFGDLGIVSVAFASWPTCTDLPTTEFFEAYGENWRALLDANPGAHIAWHGDDPWVVPLNPLLDLYSYATRAEVAEDGSVCEPEPWLAAHAITVDEALVMMTREAAYALGVDDMVGTIEVGKRADMIILDANPRTIDTRAIVDLKVRMTMIDGRVEYCDAESSLCG